MICNKETIPKNSQYRVTPQRKIILEELRSVYSHPTAQQLYEMVQKKDSHINLTTIYRTLDFLQKQNLIIRLQSKNRETRYDGNIESHCHLYCKKCGAIEDVFDIQDVKINSRELEKSGFQIQLDCLELHGLCKSCK